jgi:hypothetical protein
MKNISVKTAGANRKANRQFFCKWRRRYENIASNSLRPFVAMLPLCLK